MPGREVIVHLDRRVILSAVVTNQEGISGRVAEQRLAAIAGAEVVDPLRSGHILQNGLHRRVRLHTQGLQDVHLADGVILSRAGVDVSEDALPRGGGQNGAVGR